MHTYWMCICDCGREVVVSSCSLRNAGVKQCRSCGRKYTPKGQAGFTKVYKDYKGSAKKRGLSWNLSKADVKKITSSNCHYCGKEPSSIRKTNAPDGHGDYIYNGIDRVDNEVGYEKHNCVPCCSTCNVMKNDMSVDVFIDHIKSIHNFYIKTDDI